MIFGYKATFALALASVALSGPMTAPTLRRKLEPGTTDAYEVKCVLVKTPAEGLPGEPSTTKVTWNAAYRVESVDPAKGATMKVDVTDFDMASEGGNIRTNRPKNSTINLSVDDRNRLSAPAPDAKLIPPTLNWLPVDFLELPEKEVNVGDSWDAKIPAHFLLGSDKAVLPAKLTSEETYEGHPAWVVTLEKKGLESENKIQLQMNGEKKDAKIKGKFDVSLKLLIDKESGKTLLATGKIRGTQKIVMEDIQDQPPTGIDFSSTMKLKAPK